MTTELLSYWAGVRAGLLECIDRFDESQLGRTPFAGSWSAGEIMLHIADTEEGWFRYVARRELGEWPSGYTLGNYPTRSAIRQALSDVHRDAEQYLGQLSDSQLDGLIETPWGEEIQMRWIIWHVLEHEIHHRGELSLILGLLGREGLDV